MTAYKMLINGKQVNGVEEIDVVNPATEDVFARCPVADREQLEAMVAAARRALPEWQATPLRARGEALTRIADALIAQSEDFASLLTTEQGKPLPQAPMEIGSAVNVLRTYAAMDIPARTLRDDETRKSLNSARDWGLSRRSHRGTFQSCR